MCSGGTNVVNLHKEGKEVDTYIRSAVGVRGGSRLGGVRAQRVGAEICESLVFDEPHMYSGGLRLSTSTRRARKSTIL